MPIRRNVSRFFGIAPLHHLSTDTRLTRHRFANADFVSPLSARISCIFCIHSSCCDCSSGKIRAFSSSRSSHLPISSLINLVSKSFSSIHHPVRCLPQASVYSIDCSLYALRIGIIGNAINTKIEIKNATRPVTISYGNGRMIQPHFAIDLSYYSHNDLLCCCCSGYSLRSKCHAGRNRSL